MFNWYRDNNIDNNDARYADQKAKEWIKQVYDEKDPNAIKIDKARRHITHYFLNIWTLEESKCVKEGSAKRMCQAVGTRVLNVAFPLEKATAEFIGEKDNLCSDAIRENVKKIEDKFEKLKELSSHAQFQA